jgi:hypothetical protein
MDKSRVLKMCGLTIGSPAGGFDLKPMLARIFRRTLM